jgi:hypothetical protein
MTPKLRIVSHIISIVVVCLLFSCEPDSSNPGTSNNSGTTGTSGNSGQSNIFGTVKGVVKTVSTSTTISGVVVTCAGISATTIADGAYQLNNVPSGAQTLTATKSGYDSYSKSITVTTGTTNSDIQMTSSTSTASIEGIVRDFETNQYLANVKITIAGMTDYTDASGHYQLPSVPQGEQTIKAELQNYDFFTGTTYLYSGNKKFDIIMTWKMPRMTNSAITKTNKGNPKSTYPYSTTAASYVINNQVSVSAFGVTDAKGIKSVEFYYYINYLKLDNHTGSVELYAYYTDLEERSVKIPLTSNLNYTSQFLVGVETLSWTGYPGFAPHFERLSSSPPKIIITDTDGNILTKTLTW